MDSKVLNKLIQDITNALARLQTKVTSKEFTEIFSSITKKTGSLHAKEMGQVSMSDSGPPARPMKYPYTFSAKIAQFPLKHYFTNQWIWKYYFISLGVCIPLFYKITNSPANKAKWAEMRRKEAEEHHH
ncbi:hypothetical protein C0J52_00126 [Blattella germanica]|nr:hypothetical protein C0J52_00126 [Blattella germanica]